ncbi:MAG: IPT/TIG domain-containing protein, partial [Blastocatellia bacterium]
PRIDALSRTSDSVAGGARVTIDGANFSPDAVVTLGDARVEALEVEGARRIRFVVPRQGFNGVRTLSVRTRGGLAQREFDITPTPFAQLQPGTLGTIGGSILQSFGDGGSATGPGVTFQVGAMTTDAGGSVLWGDFAHVRRVDAATGVITTVAGTGVKGYSGDGGPAVLAQLSGVGGVATDPSGAIFIADSNAHRVRRVDPLTGTIATVAGTGEPGFSGDGGPSTEAQLNVPAALAFDGAGGLLVAELGNHRIRRIDLASGTITTIAGNGSEDVPVEGLLAVESGFGRPHYIAVDTENRVYVGLGSATVWRVDVRTGRASHFAGTGIRGPAEVGMPAIDAGLSLLGLAAMPDGSVLLSDGAHETVWQIDAGRGVLERYAGGAARSHSPDDGIGDGGAARRATLSPGHVAADALGNVYIYDFWEGFRIRRVDSESGRIETSAKYANSELVPGDLPTSRPLDRRPAMAAAGEFYVISGPYVLRWSTDDPVARAVAGSGADTDDGDGGPATEAGLAGLQGVAPDPRGGFFIATSGGARIRHVDPGGIIRTVAGTGESGNDGDGGAATEAHIQCGGVAVDSAGFIYFTQPADLNTGEQTTIRRVDPGTGRIEAFAGSGELDGPLGDGGDALAASFRVDQIAVEPDGDVYIADTWHRRIRRISRDTRIITTVAGNGEAATPDTVHDGAGATSASISTQLGFGFDGDGRLVIVTSSGNSGTDQIMSRVIRVEDGLLHVISEHLIGESPDGSPLASARFRSPFLVGVLGDGSLVIHEGLVLRVARGPLL